MDEDSKVKQAMGRKLVETMEPEEAKNVLLKVIDGDDLYAAILDGDREGDPEKPVRKKRRGRKKNALGAGLPMPPPPTNTMI